MRGLVRYVRKDGATEMMALMRFLRDESGATAIEYGLIVGMVACVLITSLRGAGTRIGGKFGVITNALS